MHCDCTAVAARAQIILANADMSNPSHVSNLSHNSMITEAFGLLRQTNPADAIQRNLLAIETALTNHGILFHGQLLSLSYEVIEARPGIRTRDTTSAALAAAALVAAFAAATHATDTFAAPSPQGIFDKEKPPISKLWIDTLQELFKHTFMREATRDAAEPVARGSGSVASGKARVRLRHARRSLRAARLSRCRRTRGLHTRARAPLPCRGAPARRHSCSQVEQPPPHFVSPGKGVINLGNLLAE